MDIDEYREKVHAYDEQLAAIYRERRRLQEAYAEDHPAVLPPPRSRTPVQERIARCPRCGGRLSDTNGLEN